MKNLHKVAFTHKSFYSKRSYAEMFSHRNTPAPKQCLHTAAFPNARVLLRKKTLPFYTQML